MGVMTADNMRDEARTMLGHPDETEYADATLYRLINAAMLSDIVCLYRLPELDVVIDKTLAANATTVDMSDVDLINVNGVIRALPDSMPMVEFDRRDLAQMAGYLSVPLGAPYHWMWTRDSQDNTGTVLRVWPKADQEYLLKVVVTRKPGSMFDDDPTEFNQIWDDILFHFFVGRFANLIGMVSRGQTERQLAKELAAAAGFQVNHASEVWHKITSPVNYGSRE
jgi:hypothetical protein